MSSRRRKKYEVSEKRQPARSRGGAKGKSTTIATAFGVSLAMLMAKMQPCQPHFVRCIKPNRQSVPCVWDGRYVTAQLKYTGVLETIRIRREGFAVRLTFGDFLRRYAILVSSTPAFN